MGQSTMAALRDGKQKIGQQNYLRIIKAIREGLSEEDLRNMSIKMGATVNVVFERETRAGQGRPELKRVFDKLLEEWFARHLYKEEVDGVEEISKLLKDPEVDLEMLAKDMKPEHDKLIDKIPREHPKIPPSFQNYITATKATPSDQGEAEVCASHGISKAITECLNDLKLDTDQKEIATTLINKMQPNKERRNPDEFDGLVIDVAVSNPTNREAPVQIVKLKLRVLTQWGEFKEDNNTFKTVPNPEMMRTMKMIVRWLTPQGPHAIYADSFNWTTYCYDCINSWGEKESRPRIHMTGVYCIDYLSIAQSN